MVVNREVKFFENFLKMWSPDLRKPPIDLGYDAVQSKVLLLRVAEMYSCLSNDPQTKLQVKREVKSLAKIVKKYEIF